MLKLTDLKLPCVAMIATPQNDIATPIHWRGMMRSPATGAAMRRIKMGEVERYRMPLVAVV
jgi:hypothetical protein